MAEIKVWFIHCEPWEDIARKLESKYQEAINSWGLSKEGDWIMELWVSEEKGSWSLIQRALDDSACIIASGQGWEVLPQALQGLPM